MKKTQKILGSILLIAGTAIGAGILALPVSTAQAGFFPTILTFLFSWFFMVTAAFYLAEMALMSTGEADLVSMAEATFGQFGKWVTTLLYLSLLYALISAYLKGGTTWVFQIIDPKSVDLNEPIMHVIVAILFGGIICYGTEIVDKFNRVFIVGLFVSFCVLMILLLDYIKLDYLNTAQFQFMSKSLPVVTASFGFSVIVPSIACYLDRDPKALKKVILIGSLLPLITYLLWEWVILGSVPGLSGGSGEGISIATSLERLTQDHLITTLVKFFSIFALLTSFLGVSLGLFHFIADLLHWEVNHKTRIPLFCLTYVPSILVLSCYPKAFIQIISFAGIFVALLLGILPGIMIWQARYRQKKASAFQSFRRKSVTHIKLRLFLGRYFGAPDLTADRFLG